MAKAVPTLDRLPLVDKETGGLAVVLETPKGSRNKYRYDTEYQAIRLSATLGEGLAFPYDFGFFPSTMGEDGDPRRSGPRRARKLLKAGAKAFKAKR
jgi:inorganic pyrophosphatase